MSIIEKLAEKHLGQKNQYFDQYDPLLLVKIPRCYNREDYGIDEKTLPFVGTDVWHAYEVSAITEKGLPVNGVLKIIVPANTECLVESKSLKLYLNSFNMTKLGKTEKECIIQVQQTVSADLSNLLDADIQCLFYKSEKQVDDLQLEYLDLSELTNLDEIDFSLLESNESLLKIRGNNQEIKKIKFKTDLLRSNCRVTNQPDWGDFLVYMETNNQPDYASVAQYVVSHRKLNHFHEEVAEMIYTHFNEVYQPKALMVTCLYTRRGGIDINPVRASSSTLLPKSFTSLNIINKRTIRQ
jgi:7-cyano-7-deazaguanine reductase